MLFPYFALIELKYSVNKLLVVSVDVQGKKKEENPRLPSSVALRIDPKLLIVTFPFHPKHLQHFIFIIIFQLIKTNKKNI